MFLSDTCPISVWNYLLLFCSIYYNILLKPTAALAALSTEQLHSSRFFSDTTTEASHILSEVNLFCKAVALKCIVFYCCWLCFLSLPQLAEGSTVFEYIISLYLPAVPVVYELNCFSLSPCLISLIYPMKFSMFQLYITFVLVKY